MGKSLTGKELGKGISQRADGLFVARFMVNGKTKTVSSRNLPDVRKKLKEARKEHESVLSGTATVKQWYYTFYKDVKSRTVKTTAHEHRLNSIAETTYLRYIGDKPITKVRKMDVQKATNQLLEERGSSTIGIGLSEMRQAFRYAIDNDVIDKNPCLNIFIDKNKSAKRKSESLDDWEIELFFKVTKHKVLLYVSKVMLLTGMRIGEIGALAWDDIDFEKKEIHVTKTMLYGFFDGKSRARVGAPKTKSSVRVVPFIGNVEEVLTEWKEERTAIHNNLIQSNCEQYDEMRHNLVFVNKSGGVCVGSYFNKRFRHVENLMQKEENRMAAEENREPRMVHRLHSHIFRHTFVTKCSDANMNTSYISKIVGHTSLSMTMMYTHTTAERMDDEVEKVSDQLNF